VTDYPAITPGTELLYNGATRTVTEVRSHPASTVVLVRLDGARQWHRFDRATLVVYCGWYAGCGEPAIGLTPHPVLGPVPICQRCAEKHDLPIDTDSP
jgi:hypothetical protein